MPKFRKKPVEIEAFRWEHPAPHDQFPQWALDAVGRGELTRAGPLLYVTTLEGVMTASPGDWIIQGVEGEIYPCKPSVFEATYDPV